MRLVWAQEAMDDRDAIFDFVEENNQIAALALDELFTEKVSRLLDHPNLGRPGRIAGTREWVVHQNYIVIYDVTGDLLRVLRVVHAARRWP